MNPLLLDILAFLDKGRQFSALNPRLDGEGRCRVEFVFPDGSSELREYAFDLPTYREHWKQASRHLLATVEAFREAEWKL